MTDQPKVPQMALLGDLESIRELFDEAQNISAAPLLNQAMVDMSSIPNDELFQALLGDNLHASYALVFDQAWRKIKENSPRCAPEGTGEVSPALQMRIDKPMQS